MKQGYLSALVSLIAVGGVAAPALTLAQTAPSDASATSQNAASGSDSLEEVVVTAERRSADVQKTGISISVRTGDVMAEEGKTNLATMLEDVPGLTIQPVLPGSTPGDNNANNFVIRGVEASVGLPGDTQPPTTALYVDGV